MVSAEAAAGERLAQIEARLDAVMPQLTAASGGWVAYRAGGVDELDELSSEPGD